MTKKLKFQIAVLICTGVLVGFAAGVYATSQFIGDFVELGAR
jgi:hypothetical protein